MAYTQTDLDKLQAAIAKGARRVRMNGEEVEFRTLKEMERLETRMKEDLGLLDPRKPVRPVTSSGWR